jgi:hypothetical protein
MKLKNEGERKKDTKTQQNTLCKRRKEGINCTLIQALRLCTCRKTHRGSRGIALPFHDHGTRRG